jgi:hydrogenase/urease accessory protein HupE
VRRGPGIVALVAAFACATAASAHESRPAYLEIEELAPERYAVLWRAPVRSGMRLPVALRLPDGARDVTAPALRALADSTVERRVVEVPGGMAGKRIEIAGLEATITDVLVRVEHADGSHATTLARPSRPWVEIEAEPSRLAVAGAYLVHGVTHILEGVDHLFFVLALLLIVPSRRMLLATITAFTVAHSITLALATLGVVHVPGPPVEALIALSIVLLAAELIRMQRGERSLTAERPWLVAFAFGLLHGLGFAGALTEVGLPAGDLPLALLAFNVGVELGQLAFVAVVLALAAALRAAARDAWLARARRVAGYAIGIAAAYWLVERLAGFPL